MRFFILFISLISLIACNKPNPNPELADEIYLDLKNRAQEAQKDHEAEKKKLEGFKKELEEVVPQTGTVKYAQKRYFESEQRVQRLGQRAKFYELKVTSRMKYTRKKYQEAFAAGKDWPTEEETEAYKKHRQVSSVDAGWDTKKRVKNYEERSGTKN